MGEQLSEKNRMPVASYIGDPITYLVGVNRLGRSVRLDPRRGYMVWVVPRVLAFPASYFPRLGSLTSSGPASHVLASRSIHGNHPLNSVAREHLMTGLSNNPMQEPV
jgi:hypothetical protein